MLNIGTSNPTLARMFLPKLVSPCVLHKFVCHYTCVAVSAVHHILCHSTLAHEPPAQLAQRGEATHNTPRNAPLPSSPRPSSPPSSPPPSSPSTSPSTGRENPWSPAVQPSEHPVTFPASHCAPFNVPPKSPWHILPKLSHSEFLRGLALG